MSMNHDFELTEFLNTSISRAQVAAEASIAMHHATTKPAVPAPFESLEEWYAFDATLTRWLANRDSTRVHGRSPRSRKIVRLPKVPQSHLEERLSA
jgi:hypothetical protein